MTTYADNIMIDLETMGTRPTSMFLSIAAVCFDPFSGQMIGEPFYSRVDLNSYQALAYQGYPAFTYDVSTLEWWMGNTISADARLEAFVNKPRYDVREVLEKFIQWCNGFVSRTSIKPWSHGASFDIPILENTMSLLGLTIPWKFWDARDTRTLFDIAKIRYADVVSPEAKKYPAHHALGDCFRQIEGVKQSLRKIKM